MNKALIIFAIIVSFLFGYIVTDQFIKPTKKEIPASIIKLHEIDTIIVDREHYIIDSIIPKEKKIITDAESATVYVDNTFKYGNDTDKVKLFNSKYPPVDTNKLMIITNNQAESAILEKINHDKDSSLMVLYKNSADDCDIRLGLISGKVVETDKLVKHDIDSAFWSGVKKGTLWTTILSILGITYILTR